MELCDRVTVLRHGKVTGHGEIKDLDSAKLSKMMVEREVNLRIEKAPAKPKDTVIHVDHLNYVDDFGKLVVNDLSFGIRAGEVVGIAGVEGNGQTEVSEIISGLLSIRDNILACYLNSGRFGKKQLLNMKKLNSFVNQCIQNFEIACTGGSENIKFLSGGNIQKVMVAREFSGSANFIIANQPTRGIDVGTSDLIRRLLVKTTRESNNAVLLISSDLAEIMEVSDRLLVMKDGQIVAQFTNVKSVTDETLGEYMLGVKRMSPEEMGDLF